MEKMILERNVAYAVKENIIYALVFLTALFSGTTFFSSGNLAFWISMISGLFVLICITILLIKKGLVNTSQLYYGYFLFGKLIGKKKIDTTVSDKFTILHIRYRQKYVRSHNEPNWEYGIDSFEIYFYADEGTIQNEIIKCSNKENSEKAKDFLMQHCNLKFVSI